MISSGDTMAGSLWHARLEYANASCLEPKQTTLPLPPRLASPIEASPSDNNSNDSELPYLCTDLVETKGVDYASFSAVDFLGSDVDNAFLMAMLSGDDAGIEHLVHSRPVLYINPVCLPGSMALSAPSPVDSGYGSRPGTPSVETYGGYDSDEPSWSPADDTFSISDESSNTHMPSEGFSDARYRNYVTDAKAASPAPQGPVIPRIILSDDEGRVVEATITDQFEGFLLESSPADEDIDSPYGGLMSLTTPENLEPASSVSYVSQLSDHRHSATGAVLDRAFVSIIRPRITPSVITPVYPNRHRAPTFVLACVGEEEEEEQRDEEECARVLFMLEEKQDECAELEDVESTLNVVEASSMSSTLDTEYSMGGLTDENCDVFENSIEYNGAESLLVGEPLNGSSTTSIISEGKGEFNTWHFEDGEDDDCEECGLILTQPDDNYHQLFSDLSRSPSEPAVVFGLLKTVARVRLTGDLNTAYHVTVQGRTFQTNQAPCSYDCERGYWSKSDEPFSVIYPHDCPAHGGRNTCEAGAIFHRSALLPLSSAEPDCASPDYQALAVEIVGLAPCERKSAEEDLDDGDLILHSGDTFRPAKNKNIAPEAGTSYDDYMSRFMDDVDLSTTGGSSDNLKNAPFGKFVGGALKDMTVPEAVDHLKEGLEKTESAFRAALTAPFRFNSVADKLTQHLKSGDSKAHPPRERRGSTAFRHHRKESSVSGIKTKWSNMLNKFTR